MKNRQRQKDTLFSILIFCSAFAVNLLIQKLFTTQTLVPMIFVFGVFLISLKTHGYSHGFVICCGLTKKQKGDERNETEASPAEQIEYSAEARFR